MSGASRRTNGRRPAVPAVRQSEAGLSPEGTYRWWLTRRWLSGPVIHWLMLNPSTADALVDDPTIRRVIGFSRRWGMGGCTITNLFALRATDPRELARHPEPVGQGNDAHIASAARESPVTVCAWGAHPMAVDRAADVLEMLRAAHTELRCLRLTKAGQPSHPLYVRADTRPVAFGTVAAR
jgi:hypothetical protein